MKPILLFFTLCCAGFLAKAQVFDYQLTGNPVATTGWTMTGNAAVNADQVDLTTSLGNQTGSIYYSTPQNLTNCSQFTVKYDFRITNPSFPTADGLAFYYITTPPSGFILGGGLGLPNNPNGLVLLFDTYDNNSTPDNPLVSLRKFDGTSNYVEGSTTGQLLPDLTNQSFITDGTWHTCTLTYYFGTITVAFDNSPTPVMTVNATLGQTGYFGFCSSTGGSWATHSIKNVHITGAPDPPAPTGTDVTYCQGEPSVALTSTGNNLKWYTVPVGGTSSNVAPTPSTGVAGTFNWYVSQAVVGCAVESQRDTVTVTVNPKPGPPNIYIPSYCSDQVSTPIQIISGQNVLWYTDSVGGTGTSVIPIVNTHNVGDTTFYVTQTTALGCSSVRIPVVGSVRQAPVANFSVDFGFSCSSDTAFFHNLTTSGTSYQWNFGDATTSADTNPVHIYNGQGAYNVSLKTMNVYCVDSVIKPILIAHALVAGFTTSDDTVCQGGTVTFTNTSNVASINGIDGVYTWYYGDNSTEIANSPTHTYTNPGVYHVTMVAKNAIPCYDSAFATIVVDSTGSLKFTINDTAVCKGVSIDFTGTYVQDGLSALTWNFGDNADNVTGTNPITHAYDVPGVYTVTATANYRACESVTDSKQVTIKAMPVLNLGPDSSLCLDGKAVLIADNINNANPKATWIWSTGETTPSITVRHDGTYTGTVTINQCSTSDVIYVKKDCYIDIPNSFTPNGDGVNDYFLPKKFLSEGVVGFTMNVFDRWGEKIFVTDVANGRGWDGTFNGKNQPQGVYIYDIRVVLKNGKFESYTGNVTLLR
jgi:gliding motility-associated-like protein